MTFILKNEHLEIGIDHPLENYNFSRFDWTGKITHVTFQNIPLTGSEILDGTNEHQFGRGFYNEFGIDGALGYEEAASGGWFHKIGIGLLKRNDKPYFFGSPYEIRPAQFEWITDPDKVTITCNSEAMNGFSYVLEKQIQILDDGWIIRYGLKNTGSKFIRTNEYVHNFMSVNDDPIGGSYSLEFPFILQPGKAGEVVNPESVVQFDKQTINFNRQPSEAFFFSQLNGNDQVVAQWTLVNQRSKIEVSVTGNFQTEKVNLWGCGHVVSPELFKEIDLKPGATDKWTRHFKVSSIL